jgi:hypothetical protein
MVILISCKLAEHHVAVDNNKPTLFVRAAVVMGIVVGGLFGTVLGYIVPVPTAAIKETVAEKA